MGLPAERTEEDRDFPGLITNSDPHDLPQGAGVDQVNITCIRPAVLTVRPGFRVVTFEE